MKTLVTEKNKHDIGKKEKIEHQKLFPSKSNKGESFSACQCWCEKSPQTAFWYGGKSPYTLSSIWRPKVIAESDKLEK